MTDTSLDDLGPVDYLVVEFPAGASYFTGEMRTELLALVDTGTIRVIDILLLTKDADGAVDTGLFVHGFDFFVGNVGGGFRRGLRSRRLRGERDEGCERAENGPLHGVLQMICRATRFRVAWWA